MEAASMSPCSVLSLELKSATITDNVLLGSLTNSVLASKKLFQVPIDTIISLTASPGDATGKNICQSI